MLKLAPEEFDIVLEIALGPPMELDAVLLVAREAPLRRLPVFAQLPLGIAPGGMKFFDCRSQAAEWRGLADDFLRRFPFDLQTGKPVGVRRIPSLLHFVPEPFARSRPFAA